MNIEKQKLLSELKKDLVYTARRVYMIRVLRMHEFSIGSTFLRDWILLVVIMYI